MGVATEEDNGILATKRARVLIVDDEPLLARTLVALLADKHDALAVTRPLEALAKLSEGARFDVILCDLAMPEMNGKALFEAIGRLSPDLQRRIVFLTGGVQSAAMGAFLESVPNPCLDKPFTEDTLLATVAQVLASTA